MERSTTTCILCESATIRNCRTIGASFRVWRCGRCGFAWVDRTDLARPEVAPCYDGYPYNRNLIRHFERMKPLYLEGLRERVARTLGARPLERCSFLDVGCANGEYLWAAGEMGFGEVVGVEIDREARERAVRYGDVVDDVRELPEASYDVMQIKNVLSNIVDCIDFMKTCLRTMKADGAMLLDVLNQDSLSAFLRNTIGRHCPRTSRFGPLRPPYVINGFNRSSLLALYRRIGLMPTWLETSYMGSPMVPYAPSLVTRAVGFAGSFFGKGPMLVSEARRPLPEEGGVSSFLP